LAQGISAPTVLCACSKPGTGGRQLGMTVDERLFELTHTQSEDGAVLEGEEDQCSGDIQLHSQKAVDGWKSLFIGLQSEDSIRHSDAIWDALEAKVHARARMMEEPTEKPVQKNVTTVMVQNLPRCLQQSIILERLDSCGFANLYDFVYAPVVFGTGRGIGYAFINFVDNHTAQSFITKFHKRPAFFRNAEYRLCVLRVTTARIQGKEANLRKWLTPKMLRVKNPNFRPFLANLDNTTADGTSPMQGAANDEDVGIVKADDAPDGAKVPLDRRGPAAVRSKVQEDDNLHLHFPATIALGQAKPWAQAGQLEDHGDPFNVGKAYSWTNIQLGSPMYVTPQFSW